MSVKTLELLITTDKPAGVNVQVNKPALMP